MNAQRQTALTATPKTMEQRRASITALIEKTADPKLKEGMRQILEEMERRPEMSPKARAWFEANKERLEETGKRTLERERQRREAAEAPKANVCNPGEMWCRLPWRGTLAVKRHVNGGL